MRKSSNRLADDLSAREVWSRRARHHRGAAERASASGATDTVTLLGVELKNEGGHHLVGRTGGLEIRAWQEQRGWFTTVSRESAERPLLAHASGRTIEECEPELDRRLEKTAQSIGILRAHAKAARQRRGS